VYGAGVCRVASVCVFWVRYRGAVVCVCVCACVCVWVGI